MSNGAVALLVEGDLDEAVARRLLAEAGLAGTVAYGKRGIGYVRSKVSVFSQAARFRPLFALADLKGSRIECAPEILRSWLPHRSPYCVLRIAIPDVEAWLLADAVGIANFLDVPVARIPSRPETLVSAKQALLSAAHHSRSNRLRKELVPGAGSTATQGPGYTSALANFAASLWNVRRAARDCSGLARTLNALVTLRATLLS